MASSSKSELKSAAAPPTLAPATNPPSLAPATTPPSPLSISAGNAPEIRGVVAMVDIKIYQRRHKEMKKEKEQLDAQKNWAPETPVKLVPVRPQTVYVKRRLKTNSVPSFLSRICGIAVCSSKVDDGGSENPLLETGMFNHGRGSCCFTKQSNECLAERDVLMDFVYRSSELSPDLSLAPPGECAIDKCPDASFRGLDITPEHPTNNFLPGFHNLSNRLPDNAESHAIGCDPERDSLNVVHEKLHPVKPLEPTTPLTKQNKRPSNCRDTNPRPVKKMKIKKKRHRPRVAVDGVPRHPIKKLPAKKEKVTRVKKTKQRGKERKSVRKRLKMSNSEVSTIENHAELVAADSSLSSLLNLTIDGKIVGILQSSVGSGPGTVNTGDQGSNEKVLLAIPELPSIHSSHDNVSIVSELKRETKSTPPQSDVCENIPSVEPKVVCRYVLRVQQPPKEELDCQCMDSCGHKEASEANLCARNSISEELNFPKQCKWTRMKRKRRPRVSVILLFFQLKGHVKKKRSKSFTRKGKMAGFQGKSLTGGTKRMEEGLVSNPSKELPIGEEQGEVNHEIYAPQSCEQLLVNQDQAEENYGGFQPTLSQYEILILKPFEALQLIDKSTTGTEKVFNHKDSIIKKEELCIRRTSTVAGEFMMPSIGETSAGAPHQDSLSVKAGAVVPYKSFPRGALVPHQGFLSPKKSAIVVHRPPTKKFKPVIELDPETLRRWNQIKRIEDGLGDEEVEVDEETKRQWEKERKIFEGNVEGFNNKMHLTLGDRKFKKWKGSVVDSVVGVFLTQNVSDFHSSSAYMSLAAMFPNEERNQEGFNCSQESTGSTSGTTEDLHGPQYFVTTYDDEGGLGDIEDIGKPILPRTSYRNEPLRTYTQMERKNSIASFHDFYQTLCSSSETVGDASILPLDCNSQAKVGREKDLESIDMHHDVKLKVNEVVPDGSSNVAANSSNTAGKKEVKKKDWARFRRKYLRPRYSDHTDTLDWEAVRQTDSSVIANVIKARGQHNIIAERIKGFLNREVELHGSIDLEWLRHAPDLVVKNYLLDVQGLGLKSVECIRLLALNRVAFPVDVNVARIVVRLGWVPLKPLPGDLQFHLLEEYPILDNVQKYLMPRLREFDSATLYEFHYQLITFGKIFCKKRSPNCGACPMRSECKHYASAVAASANLNLPGPTNEDLGRCKVPSIPVIDSHPVDNTEVAGLGISSLGPSIEEPKSPELVQNIVGYGLESRGCVPIIEEPKSPEFVQYVQDFGESEYNHDGHVDYGLESSGCVPTIEEPKSPELVQESGDVCGGNDFDENKLIDNEEEEEIPTIILNDGVFKKNVQYFIEKNLNNLLDGNSSRALVSSLMDVNSSSVHKLKRAKHLRTEHEVYEIPDGHEILTGIERRDPDDIVPYLLAIWTAGETSNSVRQPEKKCNSEGSELCNDPTCFACESFREGKADIVRGTILIPCRTAMIARFPLNGTYFQVNEVFADHETSCNPLIIPRSLIWNLRRRMVFFGTSPSSIFTKGCLLKDIQFNFWKGFICLRGFDRKTRGPKPLAPRFHCSPSKMEKTPRKVNPDKVKKTPPKPKRFNQEKPNDGPNKPQGAAI